MGDGVTVCLGGAKLGHFIFSGYQSLYLGGTPSLKTDTSPPSCLHLHNRLYMPTILLGLTPDHNPAVVAESVRACVKVFPGNLGQWPGLNPISGR